MKRLLILLSAIMVVTADTAEASKPTIEAMEIVYQARDLLIGAEKILYDIVAYDSRERNVGASANQVDADKNLRNDIGHALNNLKKAEANIRVRGKASPHSCKTELCKKTYGI